MEVFSPESFTGTSEAISRPRQATHPQRGCRRRGREKMTTVQLWITAGAVYFRDGMGIGINRKHA